MSIQPTSPTSIPQSPSLPPHLSLLVSSNSNIQKSQSQSQSQLQPQSTQPSQLQPQSQSTQMPSSLSSNQLPNSINLTTSLVSTSTSQITGNLVNSLPPLSAASTSNSNSNCILNQNSANNPNSNQIPPLSRPTKLTYNIFDRSARKIATLVKIANLPYQIQQNHETNGEVIHVLSTPFGNLHKQYQIIYYLINQSKLLSKPPQSPSNPPSEPQLQNPPQSPQPLQQSQLPSQPLIPPLPASPYSLQPPDPYLSSKMHEKLFELRITLFPLLHEFYKYLTGFQKTKKSKYDSLMTKIKKYIEELDSQINEHPEMYHSQFNFLNIIIACEISMACKFVFQEKFRKSKYSLISKYERITNRKEFVEVHGKSDLCQKEYLPSEFEEDAGNGDKGAGEKANGMSNSGNLVNLEKQLHSHGHVNSHTSIPIDIGKIQIGQIGSGVGLSPTNSINFNANGATSGMGNGVGLFDQQISYAAFGSPANSNRNQLVYYYFKQALMNFENQNLADSRDRDRQIVSSPNLSSMSKKQYFPYFWLMFEDLACTLVQISLSFPEAISSPSPSLQQSNSSKLKNLQRKFIQQTEKQIDYGFVALYQKQGKFSIRGVLCLGSKTLEEIENSLNKEKDGKEKEKQKGQGFLFVSGSSGTGQGKDNINLSLNGVANSSPCVVKLHKIDPNLEKERKQIEKIWENTSQGAIVDDFNLVGLLAI